MTRTVYLICLTDGDRQMLYKRRELMRALAEAEIRLKEAEENIPGAHSPKFDGMPKGSGGGDGVGAVVSEIDHCRNKVALLRSNANRHLKPCLRITDKLPLEMCNFARRYYVDGKTIGETAKAINRTRRSCELYRAKIEGRTKEKEP